MSDFTCVLFARPSFIEGVARLIDIGSTINEYNTSVSPAAADLNALAADWNQVGADIRLAAMNELPVVDRRQDR